MFTSPAIPLARPWVKQVLCHPQPSSREISVNWELSIEQMIALGNYKKVDPEIVRRKELFPIASDSRVVLYEVDYITWNHVSVTEMPHLARAYRDEGWELAMTAHLLAFGVAYPEEQEQEFGIINAPGTINLTYGTMLMLVRGHRLSVDKFIPADSGCMPGIKSLMVRPKGL